MRSFTKFCSFCLLPIICLTGAAGAFTFTDTNGKAEQQIAKSAKNDWQKIDFHMQINGDFIGDGGRQYSFDSPIEITRKEPVFKLTSENVERTCFQSAFTEEDMITNMSLSIYLTSEAQKNFTTLLSNNAGETLSFNYAFFQIKDFKVSEQSVKNYKNNQGKTFNFAEASYDQPDFSIAATTENIASFMRLVKMLSPEALPKKCYTLKNDEPFPYWQQLEERFWN